MAELKLSTAIGKLPKALQSPKTWDWYSKEDLKEIIDFFDGDPEAADKVIATACETLKLYHSEYYKKHFEPGDQDA
jgi:hypothetical protein